MTPHKINRRGTYVLDRQFKGVGRIKRATGTNDRKLLRLLDAMVTSLYQAGRVDVLQAIRSGALTVLEVWARFRLGELDRLPTVETMKPLRVALARWAERADTGDDNRAARRWTAKMVGEGVPKDATLAVLPGFMREYMREATAAQANHVRGIMLAFLRDTVGRSHALYLQVRDLRPRKVTPRKRPRLTVAEARTLREKLGERDGAVLWAMVTTGMGPHEFWGGWSIERDPSRVHVVGTKRSGRVRDVPFVGVFERPTTHEKTFRRNLQTVTAGAVQAYDLRGTFAHWMEEAGIPRTRRRMYLGHGAKDVTDLYERHEVAGYLVEDGAKLRAFIGGGEPTPALRLA